MELIKNEHGHVIGLTEFPLVNRFDTHWDLSLMESCRQHEVLAERIRNMKLTSVILFASHLKDELRENPKYAKYEHYICLPYVEQQARRELQNKYPSVEEVEALLAKHNIPLTKGNHFTEKENFKFKHEVIDAYFDNYKYTVMQDILSGIDESFRYDEEDEWNENPLSEEEYKKRRSEGFDEYIIPQVRCDWEREMNLPELLAHWDSRNIEQQYFFAQDGDTLYAGQGGYSSSQSRWDLGILIHAYAFLHSKNIPITTHILHYDSENVLRHLATENSFRCLHPHYGCNYHTDREVVKENVEDTGIVVTKRTYLPNEEDYSDED